MAEELYFMDSPELFEDGGFLKNLSFKNEYQYGLSDKGKTFATIIKMGEGWVALRDYIIKKLQEKGFFGVYYSTAKSGSIYIFPFGIGDDRYSIRISDHIGRGGLFSPSFNVYGFKDAVEVLNKIPSFEQILENERLEKIESDKKRNEQLEFLNLLSSKNMSYGRLDRTYQNPDQFKQKHPEYSFIKSNNLGTNRYGETAYEYEFIKPGKEYSGYPTSGYIEWYKNNQFAAGGKTNSKKTSMEYKFAAGGITGSKFSYADFVEILKDSDETDFNGNPNYKKGTKGYVKAIKIVDGKYLYTLSGMGFGIGILPLENVKEEDLKLANEEKKQEVEKYLDKKQEKKEFKDIGKRVSGSKKEQRAYNMITLADLADLELDEITAAKLVTKDKVFPEFNIQEQRDAGVTSGAAYLKVKLREACGSKPPNKPEKRMSFVKFITFLNEAIKPLKTVEEVYAFLDSFRNYKMKPIDVLRYFFEGFEEVSDEAEERARILWVKTFGSADPYYVFKKAIAEVFGKRFENFIFMTSDSAKEDLSQAKKYQFVTAEQEKENREKWVSRHQKMIEVNIEKKSQYEKANDKELDILMSDWNNARKLYKKNYEEFRKFAISYYERRINEANKGLLDFPDHQKERPDDWSWFEAPKERKEVVKSGEPKINSWPPLHYIKRTGGLVIKDDFIKEAMNADPEQNPITRDFGFKSVQFGNALKSSEAREHIRHFLGAITDLAEILDINIKDLNNIGGLSMAFAARGGGSRAAATYERGRCIINLTNSNGDGSLAHEIGHYIDNAITMAGKNSTSLNYGSDYKKLISRYTRQETIESYITGKKTTDAMVELMDFIYKGKEGVTPKINVYYHAAKVGGIFYYKGKPYELTKVPVYFDEIEKKFLPVEKKETVQATINYLWTRTKIVSDPFYRDPVAQAKLIGYVIGLFDLPGLSIPYRMINTSAYYFYSQQMQSKYWIEPWELFARAWETYIFDKLAKKNRSSNYLVSGAYFTEAISFSNGGFGCVYPVDKEREYLFTLYEKLIQAIKDDFNLSGFKAFTNIREDEYKSLEEDKEFGGKMYEDGGEVKKNISDEILLKRISRVGTSIIEYNGVNIPLTSKRSDYDNSMDIWIGERNFQGGIKLVVYNKKYDHIHNTLTEIKESIYNVYENFIDNINARIEYNNAIDSGAKDFNIYSIKKIIKDSIPEWIGKEANARSGSDYLYIGNKKVRFADHDRPADSKWNFIHGQDYVDAIEGLLTKQNIIDWIESLIGKELSDEERKNIYIYFDKLPTPKKLEVNYPEKKLSVGGATFSEKVNAISNKFKGQPVPAKYRSEYGKRYDADEAKEAAQRIVGSMVKSEKMERGGEVLNDLNPTGGIFVDYSSSEIDKLPLGENITTYDKTAGISPDTKITVYRGVPEFVSSINSGDFITTNKQLAKDYAGTGKVISKEVRADEILDDITEPLGEEYILRLKKTPSVFKGFTSKEGNKVVGADGNPLVLYHGTPESFKNFDISEAGKSTDTGMWGRGIYFTDDKKEAERYATRNGRKGRIIEAVIIIKNPYVINSKSDIPEIKTPKETIDDLRNAATNYSFAFTKYLQERGYDGVIDNIAPEKQYVVFDPSQIRIINDISQNNTKMAKGGKTFDTKEDNKAKNQYLYHGTGEAAFRRIREEGLVPKDDKHLYFSNTELYAKSYAQRKGNPFGNRILRVKKTDSYLADENTTGGDFKIKNKINPNDIELKHNGKWIPIQQYSDESIGIMPIKKEAEKSTFKKGGSLNYYGHTFTHYNKPVKAPKGDKHKMMVLVKKGDEVKLVKFGLRGMEDYTQHKDKKRKENYLSRSAGINDGDGNPTKSDPFSANYWARRILWDSKEPILSIIPVND